jgi:uncharacterized SAM-binding protein YcdF (DUF218 family)
MVGMLRRWRYHAIGSVLLFSATVLSSEVWWWSATSRNQVACLETRQVAVVFYAGNVAEDYRRLESAFDLVRSECVASIALVGGDRPERGFNGSEANAAILLAMGMPRERILLGSGSFDSQTNLDEMAGILDARGWRSSILVSDCLHLDRLARLSRPLTRFRLDRSCSRAPPFGVRLWRSGYEVVAYTSSVLPPSGRSWMVRWLRAQFSISDESPSNE